MWPYREAQKKKEIWQYLWFWAVQSLFSDHVLEWVWQDKAKTTWAETYDGGTGGHQQQCYHRRIATSHCVPTGTIPSQRLRWQKSLLQKADNQFTISLSLFNYVAGSGGKIKSWTPYILPGWNTVTGHFNSQADTRVQFRVTRLFPPGPNQH